MEFRFERSLLNTDDMHPFPTGLEASPVIYVTASGDCFLERLRAPGFKPVIVHLHPDLRDELIAYCRLEALRSHLLSLAATPIPPSQIHAG